MKEINLRDTHSLQERYGEKDMSVMTIGKVGENLVAFDCTHPERSRRKHFEALEIGMTRLSDPLDQLGIGLPMSKGSV